MFGAWLSKVNEEKKNVELFPLDNINENYIVPK